MSVAVCKEYEETKTSVVQWAGKIPAHWKVQRIGYLFRESAQRASTNTELDYPILSVSIHDGISDKEMDEDEMDRKVTRSDDRSLYKVVQDNDLAYNMMRAWQGGFGAAQVNGLISPAYVVCKPRTSLPSKFFELLLRTPTAVTELKRFSRGITDFRLRLYWDDFKKIEVAVPPANEQQQILKFLDYETAKIDALIEKQQQLIALLGEKRQAVISHAVTKGLNPDAPMRDSGVEWIGRIPEHWRTPSVYARYNAVLGKMYDENKLTGLHPIVYLRNADVNWDSINIDSLPVIDVAPHELERFTVMKGDLLICEGGAGIGQTAIWQGELEKCAFQKALHRLRPLDSDLENPRFFYYCMRFVIETGYVLAGGTATIPHLTGEQLRKYRFPCPPKHEQDGIVSHLDRLSERFNKIEALATDAVELLQERRTALISAAVTGKIDVRVWKRPSTGSQLETEIEENCGTG